ncbi:MAG: DEAD/DEAH box helicase, partial [Myxococcota bacterium]|nr:DEAD/DEAH box helicase [Myxococcota bacterium]
MRQSLGDAGFEKPTDPQRAAFEPIRAGRDVVIQARTGTGKTAAVAVPLLDGLPMPAAEPLFLALAPTRELALQFAGEFQRLGARSGARVAVVYGGVPVEPQLAAIRAGAHGIVATPGRIIDLMDRDPRIASRLRILILDEVDEMLSMGFERDVEAIVQRFPGRYQGIFLCATLPAPILRLADRFLREPAVLSLSDDAISPGEIRHFFFMIDPTNRLGDLVRIMETERPETSFVFCNTRDDAQVAASYLEREGFDVALLSGELSQPERERVMARVREGQVAHLVATDVAARGIDVLHLTHVIHYQFPQSLEQYVHRSGRVGRLGQPGTAISLIGPQDLGSLYFLRLTFGIRPLERSLPSEGEIKREHEAECVRVLVERHGGSRPDALLASILRRLRTRSDGDAVLAAMLGEMLRDVDPRARARESEREKRKAAAAAAARAEAGA